MFTGRGRLAQNAPKNKNTHALNMGVILTVSAGLQTSDTKDKRGFGSLSRRCIVPKTTIPVYAEASAKQEVFFMAEKRQNRTRNWAFVFYPGDSAPDNWQQILDALHVKCLVSPLHNRDVNEDGSAKGQPKKDHRHGLLMYDGPKTYEQVCEDLAPLNGQVPVVAKSVTGVSRYMTHMDNPEKAQYSKEDVVELGGASWAACALSETDQVSQILDEIESWCDEYSITSYRHLCRYARAERPDWTPVIRRNTIHLSAYLRSIEWEQQN